VDVPGWIYLTIAIIDSSIVLNSRNLDIIFFIRFFSDFIIRLFLVIEIIRDLNCWYLKALSAGTLEWIFVSGFTCTCQWPPSTEALFSILEALTLFNSSLTSSSRAFLGQ